MIREIEALFERQVRAWPLLAKGIAGLARSNTRPERVGGLEIFIRHIPHRITSTTAATDRESIAGRPCFLCVENLPPEEEGLPFDANFTIYCNPFPIVDRHLTIAHNTHIPQRIVSRFGSMLDLAAALPGYFIIYNGPECGASAPDHMHFQAGSRNLLPVAKDTAGLRGPTVPGDPRRTLLFRERDRPRLIDRVESAVDLLAQVTGRSGEPLVNIATFCERGEYTTFLFPRRKHRPNVFDTGELTVSPATIDFCGIFVVPLEKDFQKITADGIAAVFREVALPQDQFDQVVAGLERAP